MILVGTLFAYVHWLNECPGKVIVDALIDLPLVLPPGVTGLTPVVLWGGSVTLDSTFPCLGSRSHSRPSPLSQR
ncbi:MAG: hypothetical protein WCF90_06235 [Methanomicrobiales archaeon]